jgi:hypothetical protein
MLVLPSTTYQSLVIESTSLRPVAAVALGGLPDSRNGVGHIAFVDDLTSNEIRLRIELQGKQNGSSGAVLDCVINEFADNRQQVAEDTLGQSLTECGLYRCTGSGTRFELRFEL